MASRIRNAGRLGLLVVGIFSGLLLKGLSHILIALDVPGATALLAVSHIVIGVLAAAILLKVILTQARMGAREGRAKRTLDESLAAGEGTPAEQTVGPLVASGAVPAAVAGTVAGEHGSTQSFGAVDEHTLFEIGSLSKVFTALLLADMAEHGELSLDDRLDAMLPSLQGTDAGAITLAGLATHHSGLPRLPSRLMRHLVVDSLRQDDPTADPYAASTPEELEEDLRRFRRRGSGEPRFRYSNFGYAALGLALSRAAGAPYEQLVETRVCVPLGLGDTVFDPGDRPLADGHNRQGHAAPPWHTAAFAPAAGLHSTGVDMVNLARAALEPQETPLAAAFALAQEPRATAGKPEGSRIGLAWLTRPLAGGGEVLWHNGGTGGFGAFLGVEREKERAAIVLSGAAHTRVLDRAGLELVARTYRE